MGRARTAMLALVVGTAAWPGAGGLRNGASPPLGQARAEEGWRKEFDEVCAKTQDAMALSLEELRSLVDRCDKLKPLIEKLEESHRKVYSRRLQACRDLYQFVLESREKKQAQ